MWQRYEPRSGPCVVDVMASHSVPTPPCVTLCTASKYDDTMRKVCVMRPGNKQNGVVQQGVAAIKWAKNM